MKKILKSPNLSEFPNLMHGFTTRELGNDYDRISQELKVLPSQIYSLKQIHSDRVIYLSQGMDLAHLSEGDALVTDRKDIIIGIKTADCVPILVYDCEREVVAAIHAGHKGMSSGIIQKTFTLLKESFKCDCQNLMVALGPSICVDHYEVDQTLIDHFKTTLGDKAVVQIEGRQKPHLDLKATALNILTECGVDPLQFIDMKLCTFEHKDLFYSYRRQAGEGRQLSFIGMVS